MTCTRNLYCLLPEKSNPQVLPLQEVEREHQLPVAPILEEEERLGGFGRDEEEVQEKEREESRA